MVKDGIYYGLGLSLAAVAVGYLTTPWAATPFLLLAAFCLYFFRDPERTIPAGAVCVSPADGKIVHVRETGDGRTRISIFLNIFNVHVNRVPIAGRIVSVEYRAGRFLMAHKELASADNEQNTLVIREANGSRTVEIRQIAGLIARRIVCHKKVGDNVEMGERFGLIKFGSRTDIFLGPEWELSVAPGDKVAGGSSILARRRSPRQEPRRHGDEQAPR